MTIVGRAFLSAKSRAVRTVHVQDDLFDTLTLMDLINPLAGLVHQNF